MIFNTGVAANNSEEIAAMLTQFISEVESTLTTFKSEIDADITALSTDMTSKIAAVTTNVNSKFSTLTSTINSKGAVKSVQRGVHGGSSDTSNITININSVNPSKCLVLLSQHRNSWTYANDYRPQLVSITATSITVSPSGTYSDGVMSASSFSWQVVEFY